jgi:hypothetical protein
MVVFLILLIAAFLLGNRIGLWLYRLYPVAPASEMQPAYQKELQTPPRRHNR